MINQNSTVKDMLLTLLKNGNIGISDIIGVLFDYKEDSSMTKNKIPKPTYRSDKDVWVLNVPKKLSTDGKRHQVRGKTKEDAITEYKKFIIIPEDGITVESYMLYVLLTYFYKNVDNTTYDRYEGAYLKHVLNSEFGKKQICDVTGDYLTEWMKGFTNGSYQKQTPAHLKVLINETFLRAEQNKIITKNVSEYMSISYKQCKSKKDDKELFTLDELQRIEKVIIDSWEGNVNGHIHLYHYSPIFMIMALSGIRIGEMIALKKEDINREEKYISISRQCVEEYERDDKGHKIRKTKKITSPKTDTSVRIVPLSDSVLYWIDELERRQSELKIKSEFVFTNRKGKHPLKSNIYDMWAKVLNDAKVEYRPCHKLRKTFITLSIDGGVEMADVAKMVGHKDITTTINTYYKPVIDKEKHLKDAKIIDGIFGSSNKNKLYRFDQ